MTNEQHIANLKKLRSFHNGSYGASVDAAIKALEELPKRRKEVKRWKTKALNNTVSKTAQDCDTCEVGDPCLYCKHKFDPQESEEV